MARLLVVGLLLSCGSVPLTPTLVVSVTPGTLDAIGRTARVRVVATEGDGTIGKGEVELSTSLGELDETHFTLDDFGTVNTTLRCPATIRDCAPGAAIDILAIWKRRQPPEILRASRTAHLGAPPSIWTVESCPEEARLVYLFTDSAGLYSFHPPSKTLRRIGGLTCPAGSATPNSMAVGQDGIGWVNYSNGALYRINVRTASCQATTFVPPSGWTRFGMGFKPETSTSVRETLFIAGHGDQGLATVDITTMSVKVVGAFTGAASGSAELTGTADAELWGYFMPSGNAGSMRMAKIDPATAVTTNLRVFPELTVNPTAFAYAFSAWGAEFYLYTSSGSELSTVTRYQPSTDTSSRYLSGTETGLRIVGAGVSRCGQ